MSGIIVMPLFVISKRIVASLWHYVILGENHDMKRIRENEERQLLSSKKHGDTYKLLCNLPKGRDSHHRASEYNLILSVFERPQDASFAVFFVYRGDEMRTHEFEHKSFATSKSFWGV